MNYGQVIPPTAEPNFFLGLWFLLLAVVIVCAILWIIHVMEPKIPNKPQVAKVLPFRRKTLKLCCRHVRNTVRKRLALVTDELNCDMCKKLKGI